MKRFQRFLFCVVELLKRFQQVLSGNSEPEQPSLLHFVYRIRAEDALRRVSYISSPRRDPQSALGRFPESEHRYNPDRRSPGCGSSASDGRPLLAQSDSPGGPNR